ncbi:hypothetical protein EH206_00665 [Brenneria nigrifluens DSM 30175 = ATCC 13028]|nr:hypothetical protein EH206_00665 [Brenneria nigrifluens DSM 30175 = ATCC 13028]
MSHLILQKQKCPVNRALRLLTKSPASRRYPGLPYRGALRRLTPLRPLATLSLITGFVNGLNALKTGRCGSRWNRVEIILGSEC